MSATFPTFPPPLIDTFLNGVLLRAWEASGVNPNVDTFLQTDVCAAMRTFVRQHQARQLLHNKFVVVLGASVQRSMYKDLVLLLQRDQYLTLPQLKSKGEFSFEQDNLMEGGRFGPMNNGTDYREVRQYCSDHHLLRFYFLTRIYSPYVESILDDFSQGIKPDVIIISSCVWDMTRYGLGCLEQYKENLHKFFGQIKTIVCHDCLILWTLAMPLAKKIKGGFLVPEVSHLSHTLCHDIIEANFYSSQLAETYGLDVLDLHFHFRISLQHRMPDGVHWNALAHRRISSLLLRHIADAWGVGLPDAPSPPERVLRSSREGFGRHRIRPRWPGPRPLMDLAPLQRCGLAQYWQSHFRPPYSDRAVHVRPPLMPTQLSNQPVPTAGHHYGGQPPRYPLQLPLYRQHRAAFHGVPVHPPPPPAGGSYWQGGSSRFNPHFQSRRCCIRRRRSDFRVHPYPPQPPRGAPRYPAYGW